MKIPVNIAAQVVAAGIYGDRARITLALTPVFDKDNGRYDLANWPQEIEQRFLANATDGDSGVEAKQFRLEVVPIKEKQSWRTPNIFSAPKPIEQGADKLKRVGSPIDVGKLNKYWHSVMEGADKLGFEHLYKALDPATEVRDPLEYAMRPLDGMADKIVPDIHGTSRAKAVQELVLERGAHILAGFGNRTIVTRSPAKGIKSLSAQIKQWRKDRIGPWPQDKKKELTAATLAALAEDDASWDALCASRRRADKFAAARLVYQDLQATSKQAICALVKAHQYLLSRTPLAAAMHFSADNLGTTTVVNDPLPEAIAAYRLASQTPTFDGAKSDVAPVTDDPGLEFARRRLHMLQSNPSLGRLFRFVVDFECPVTELAKAANGAAQYDETVLDRDPDGPEKLPDAVAQKARFLLIRFCKDKGPRLWSAAKLRMPLTGAKQQAAGHFLPCTREEIDARAMDRDCKQECADPKSQACKDCLECSKSLRELAVAEQVDGIVDLGQRWGAEHRYEVITLDPVVATAAEDQKVKRAEENRHTLDNTKGLSKQLHKALEEDQKGTHRGGGLALVDRWRQLHGMGRHLDSRGQKQQYDQKADVVLDASDLVAGYKLDVGVLDRGDDVNRRRWHTLMHRTVAYTPTKNVPADLGAELNAYITKLYPDAATRRDAEDGQLQAPAALRDWITSFMRTSVADSPRDWITVFMEEVIGAWRGDPLGLACGVESYKLSPDDVRIDVSYNLPTGPALTPPPLRFGWPYHFGLRAFFAGGVSMPLDRALGHYEKDYGGDLVRPSVPEGGAEFKRHERIDAPAIAIPDWMFGALKTQKNHTDVALRGRFPVPQAGRMVVRSFDDPTKTNLKIAGVPETSDEQGRTPGVGFDRRVLMAPPVSLQFAALHDAFRAKSGNDIERDVKMCEPRVLLDPPDRINNPFETTAVDGEEEKVEYTPVLSPKDSVSQVWGNIRVAWRPFTVASRPRGGLRGVDHRAAWGGFPVYRAKASAGLVKPVFGAPVVRPAAMTDEGEILHRVKGDGELIFDNDPKRTRLLWSAVGVFGKEEGQSDRAGAAVFRPLTTEGKKAIERLPYYPDPAATTLVIEVTIRGQEKPHQEEPHRTEVAFYTDTELKRAAPADYPDAIPVVLDVIRGNGIGKVISDARKVKYSQVPHTPPPGQSIPVAYVQVTLPPGAEANIRCWCVPSVTFLRYVWGQMDSVATLAVARGIKKAGEEMDIGTLSVATVDGAFVKGLAQLASVNFPQVKNAKSTKIRLGFAGLPMPSDEQMLAFAEDLRKRMLEMPLSEIASVAEIEAVHAVDLPKHGPRVVASKKWQLLRATAESIDSLLGPEEQCKATLGDRCVSDNWSMENQMPDAVGVLIDGSLTVHGPSTEAVEICARGTAAARGRFDDVERGRSRDDRARGLWPKPDAQEPIKASRLFGFDPADDGSVSFEPETVTLLRVEGFLPGTINDTSGEVRIDLLDFQRNAKAIEQRKGEQLQANDPPLRASRPAAFPDTRARWIEIFAVAISRHAAALRTRYGELPEVLSEPKTVQPSATKDEKEKAELAISKVIMDRRWLPATVRPARVVSLSPIPAFAWSDNVPTPTSAKIPSVFVSRTVRVRIRVQRPWFSSGEGERLGVVIWPPNLFDKDVGKVSQDVVRPEPADRKEINLRALPPDGSLIQELQDADLGTGGAWVTRWGADPIRTKGGVQGWLLSKDNFPGVTEQAEFTKAPQEHPKDAVLVKNVLMPVPVDADAAELRAAQPPGGFMAVSIITYAPRFDPAQEIWYADIDLNPCGAVYPFVRLGLVRYQPNAPRALQMSEPVVEWAQVMPERKLSASARYVDKDRKQIEVTATLEGTASGPDVNNGHPETSPAQAPRVYFSLLQRRIDADDAVPDSELVFAGPQIVSPGCGCASGTAVFQMSDEEYRSYEWSIFAEEVDRLRPASYFDEPRYGTIADTNFVDTGPRFTARLSLKNLKVQ
ncbi:hypothetical protein [Mesorhizobium onobrychidis]|uniref:Uncharacterized protein n=1 Tax=Mesorhizobium onobrychidis TaxID=2775404 RepID=A0ABY5R5S9_9HYPH|nr:hypothetical protein [Mesorhizobium onobrychidis]UVC18017.1 hypothetical protein IHQ72_13575 [Mesorhizobium onobrychidis]